MTDHKAVSMKIMGMKILRREDKQPWQRPLYKTKQAGEAQMSKVAQAVTGWEQVGKGPKEKLASLTNNIQTALQKEVGQQPEQKKQCRAPIHSSLIKQLRQEANEIRKALGKSTQKEERIKWWQQERERCTKKQAAKQHMTTSELKVLEDKEAPEQVVIQWQMKKRWQALNKAAKKEEDKLLLAHWKQREEVKQAGEDYVPWASYMWKQGKAVQHREPDIIALEDPKTQEIKIEKGMQTVMEDYMKWLWGTKQNKKMYKTKKVIPKRGDKIQAQPETNKEGDSKSNQKTKEEQSARRRSNTKRNMDDNGTHRTGRVNRRTRRMQGNQPIPRRMGGHRNKMAVQEG